MSVGVGVQKLNSTEKRMAFHANLLENGKLKLSDEVAEESTASLPLAIEAQSCTPVITPVSNPSVEFTSRKSLSEKEDLSIFLS